MPNPAITQRPRSRIEDEPQSALSYWGTGLACIGAMIAICIFAGLRF